MPADLETLVATRDHRGLAARLTELDGTELAAARRWYRAVGRRQADEVTAERHRDAGTVLVLLVLGLAGARDAARACDFPRNVHGWAHLAVESKRTQDAGELENHLARLDADGRASYVPGLVPAAGFRALLASTPQLQQTLVRVRTCPWWSQYRGGRGPCKHVLSVGLVLETRS